MNYQPLLVAINLAVKANILAQIEARRFMLGVMEADRSPDELAILNDVDDLLAMCRDSYEDMRSDLEALDAQRQVDHLNTCLKL